MTETARKTDEKLSIPIYGAGSITVKGILPNEVDIALGSILGGHYWIRGGKDGRLEHVPSYEKLPEPITDEKMQPFWNEVKSEDVHVQLKMFSHITDPAEYWRYSSPSITIQYLCGYDYTKEGYTKQAKLLESFGFECLRSRRGDDGKFWEIWYLSGLWRAKGSLLKAIDVSGRKNEKLQAKVAVEFLRQNVSFGTLDISVQRLAQIME